MAPLSKVAKEVVPRARTPPVMLDLTGLTPTSEKPQIPWRKTRVGLVLLRAEGGAEQAHVIPEKLRLVQACGRRDQLLAVWMQQHHPVVFWVDDREAARAALRDG